jgi:hypothetical protein
MKKSGPYLSQGDLAGNFAPVSSQDGFVTVIDTIQLFQSAIFSQHLCG